MKKSQFDGIFDLALSMAKSFVASTETPVDDTFVRYAEFFRNDPSYENIMGRLFGLETAALVDGADVAEVEPVAVAEMPVAEALTAEDAARYAELLLTVLATIRKARQARRAAGG